MIRRPGGIAIQIALAALAVAGLAIAILAIGVVVVGGQSFADLMTEHGENTESSQRMFTDSVGWVVVGTSVVAIVVAVVVAATLGARLAMPLRQIGRAARQIAEGDYLARIARRGPEEIVSLSDSFNQMAAALEEQERIRREFIANAAHELRTPLTNLQGYLEALRDGVIEPDRATFESLLDESERLVRLSRSLDTLAAGDAGLASVPVDLDLAAVIRSAVDLARPASIAAGLALELDLPDRLRARGDPDQLAQVVGNLLQNAIRYTPAGGSVAVRVERRPGDVLVSVSNTGDGIPANDLPHVFERFYRVEKSRDRAHGGAGIGLAIVRQLVEAAGGAVGAESRDGVTRFWFSLPD
ncbi:MAG: HAMP domain-containing histidine kinase [Chloroflexi bacterium]|nr:HAMP domain-containing histidine kinase [Chloroflexota bacterium]